jgi:voltage-gated sodium channel
VSKLANYIRNRSIRGMFEDLFLKEKIVLSAIIINAFIIFLMAFPHLETHSFLIHCDNIFVVYFTLEAILKIRKFGFKGYISQNWNKFDFLIVIFSLPLLLESFIPVTESAGIITIFRLFRLLRVVRFFQFVPNLQHILVGLARAFRASIFVFVMLIFLNFILSVLTTYIFGKTLPQFFGDPILSAFTIFQMFTLEGWNEIPATIAENTSLTTTQINMARLYFAIVVLLGGVFGMSIANAIFVDEMTMDNNAKLEEKVDKLQVQIDRMEALLIAQTNNNTSPIVDDNSDN